MTPSGKEPATFRVVAQSFVLRTTQNIQIHCGQNVEFWNPKTGGTDRNRRALKAFCFERIHPVVLFSVHNQHTVGSRFTIGLRSRIFGCKSNRRKTSII